MNTFLTLRNGKVRENLNTNHALRPCTNEYYILTFFCLQLICVFCIEKNKIMKYYYYFIQSY